MGCFWGILSVIFSMHERDTGSEREKERECSSLLKEPV